MSEWLSLDQISIMTTASKAMLRRHWDDLVVCGLAHRGKVAHVDNIEAIHEKLFWIEYETQFTGNGNSPPFLAKGVAGRILHEVMDPRDTYESVSRITGIEDRILFGWGVEQKRCRVINFEVFLINYNGTNMFEHITLPDDITLSTNYNLGRKKGAMSKPTYDWTCPVCQCNKYLVTESRRIVNYGYLRRRHVCVECGFMFTTKEPLG